MTGVNELGLSSTKEKKEAKLLPCYLHLDLPIRFWIALNIAQHYLWENEQGRWDFSRIEERRTLARLCNNRANWDWKTCFFMNTIRTGLFFLRNSLGDKKTCGFDSLDHYMHGNCTCPEPSLTLMICFSTTCLSILDLTSTTHTHTIFCNGRLPDQTVRGPGTLFLH